MDAMDNAEKMGLLIGLLRRDLNGAVVDSMEEMGIHYRRNWGVSLPAIRKAAGVFSPDHTLARFLYSQELRELKLSSFIIAEPNAVSAEELEFWGAGVENAELAENLAFSLLSRTALEEVIADLWLRGDKPPLLEYCALLALARMLDNEGFCLCRESLGQLARRYSHSGNLLTEKAASGFLARLKGEL